jgi:hypothetical protein
MAGVAIKMYMIVNMVPVRTRIFTYCKPGHPTCINNLVEQANLVKVVQYPVQCHPV